MSSQRRFAPIGVRFEPEKVAAFTGIYSLCSYPFLSGVEGMHDEGRYASPHGMNHLGFISIQPHPDDHGPITFA